MPAQHSARELSEIRSELDEVDSRLVLLFEKRMQLCREVARAKIANGLPVLDRSREEQVLASRAAMLTDTSLTDSVRELYQTMMSVSRHEQEKMMQEAERHA